MISFFKKDVRRADLSSELRLFRYACPYGKRLLLGMIFSMVSAGSLVGGLSRFGELLESSFMENASLTTTCLVLSVLLLLALLMGAGKFLSTYYLQWVGQRVVMDLRVEVFQHLQGLSVLSHTDNRTGDMISRVVSDTQMVQRAVSTVLTDLIRQPILFIGLLGYLVYLDWVLSIATLVLFPLCIAPVLILGKRVRRASRQGQERMADLSSVMQETLNGVYVVKAFCGEKREQKRFAAHCRGVFSRTMKMVRSRAVNEPIMTLFAMIGIGAALVYAKVSDMPWPDFITFALSLGLLYEPVKKLSKIHMVLQQSAAAGDRVFELLDTPLIVRERDGAAVFDETLEHVSFEHVSFSYGDQRKVFSDLSVVIPAGQSVALVGGSGAGKTTMVNLLLRFFDPCSGTVKFNQRDIRDLTLKSVRGSIGYVTQETFLFNDTVAANIAYGKPDATRDEIVSAAKRAHADVFIRLMPNGYDTRVGERGTRLSGGQRQRLAIARALITDPAVLVLDEATSALDTESERQVQAAIDELIGERTVVAIAHRLSTVIKCDQILVLGDGGIMEQGTHHELLSKSGDYKRLYEMQFYSPTVA